MLGLNDSFLEKKFIAAVMHEGGGVWHHRIHQSSTIRIVSKAAGGTIKKQES